MQKLIVGLGGSYSSNSKSLRVLEAALESAARQGVRTKLLDVAELDLPLFGSTRETPQSVQELLHWVRQADGMIWSSPMYHGTISGAFKNALDWLELLADDKPAYLTGKPVGLIATAGGVRAIQAAQTMVDAAFALRAWVLPLSVPVNQVYQQFTGGSELANPQIAGQLEALGREMALAVERLRPAAALV